MPADTLTWQTDANGLLILEFAAVVAVYDDSTGSASDGGVERFRGLGFEPVPSDLGVTAHVSGGTLTVSAQIATRIWQGADGTRWTDTIRHRHPEWAASARRNGFAPVLISFGAALLPDATDDRIRRHAQAGDLLGGLVALA